MTTPSYDATDTARPPAPAESSAWEDIIDIFYAPSSVFERRRDGRYGVAFVIQSILMGVLFYAMFTVLSPVFDAMADAAMRDAMAKNPQITPESVEQMRSFTSGITLVFLIVTWPILVLVVGTTLWLIGKLFDSTATFKQAMAIATFAEFPRLIGQILIVLQGLLIDVSSIKTLFGVSLTPARFMDQMTTNPYLLLFLSRFDPFLLWSTVLLAIGLSIIGNIPRDKAAIAAIIVWALGLIPQLSQASQLTAMQASP